MQAEETVDWDSIFEKLVKLQELAKKPGTMGEAEASAAAIQRLLFKYNLSIADVEKHSSKKKKKATYDKFFINLGARTKWLIEWKRELVQAVAFCNFCRGFYFPNTATMAIIGSEINATVTRDLSFYLIEAVRQLCNVAWKENAKYEKNERKWRESYYHGAVSRLEVRLRSLLDEMKADAGSSGTSLVVQERALVEEATKHHFPNVQSDDEKEFDGIDHAAALGYKEAGRISLNKQLKGKK